MRRGTMFWRNNSQYPTDASFASCGTIKLSLDYDEAKHRVRAVAPHASLAPNPSNSMRLRTQNSNTQEDCMNPPKDFLVAKLK